MEERNNNKEIENILAEAPLIPEPKKKDIKKGSNQMIRKKKIIINGYIEQDNKGNITKLVLST